MNQKPHHLALSKAKINLMAKPDTVFYTTVCFNLLHKFDDSIRTAATDGKTIYFNTKFFMGLTVEEQVFLLLHETMHAAYLHMERVGDRNKSKWNQAADYVINLQLVNRGFKMPSMGLLDYQYEGMSTEQVYALLPNPPEDDSFDIDLLPPDGDPAELQKEMEDILVQAAIQSKIAGEAPGSIPGDIQIFLNKLLNPKLPWQKILQKFLQAVSKNDYTFRKPNRRFFPEHILPSLYSEKMIDLVVAIDTSGSVSDHEFNICVSELASIMKMMKPEKISFIQFDTDIKSVTPIKNLHDLMNTKFTGRGGTDIRPVIEWINEKKPKVSLIFTDGHFRFRDATTKNNVVWLIHDHEQFTSPFGKVIHYSVKENA